VRLTALVVAAALGACRGAPANPAADASVAVAPPAPEAPSLATLVAASSSPRRFTAVRPSGDMVWVLESDGQAADVARITVTDGTRAVVARGVTGAMLLAATPSSIVYAQACEDKRCVYEARVDGTPYRLVTTRDAATSFAVDDDAVHYVERARGAAAVMRAPRLRGLRATTVATLPSRDAASAATVVVDKRGVYVHVEGALYRIVAPGGKAEKLADVPELAAPTSDGMYLYWIEGQLIRRMPAAGGAAQTIARGAAPRALVADTTSLYWVDGAKAGAIRRIAKRGGPDEAFPVGGDVEPLLAVDGAYVYSIDAGTHALQRSGK
jgi:hypothetical protein